MIMNKKRVLYIEDDETLAFLTADNLEQYFDVTHCNNGQNGFDTFCKDTFDIVVLDIMLPDMDGFEIAENIRKKIKKFQLFFFQPKR